MGNLVLIDGLAAPVCMVYNFIYVTNVCFLNCCTRVCFPETVTAVVDRSPVFSMVMGMMQKTNDMPRSCRAGMVNDVQ